ncbi:hypothetical protein B0T14DRAFT_554245 [Immersiella caudata]|uniref:F-box domain-containing protein n=1 Tax=Immersiella caudata TaxID=314043 RepID=A0AA39WZC1_9PEZI|nr:hypothetical protein B0T14DRAFT_554245 [Immersiella caudata]
MSTKVSAPHIMRQPDEVLNQIISNVLVYPERNWWRPDFDKFFGDARAILLTCRRFYHLAVPHLYRRLEITWGRQGFHPSATETATKHLHRTVNEDRSLHRHCLDLQVHIGDPDPAWQSWAIDFVTWLTRVQRLKISGGFHASAAGYARNDLALHVCDLDGAWEVIHAATQSMPDLFELTIAPTAYGHLSLPRTMSALRCAARLRILHLNGANTNTGHAWDVLPGSSPIASLTLHNFKDSFHNLGHLLSLPSALDSFNLGPNVHTLQPSLSLQDPAFHHTSTLTNTIDSSWTLTNILDLLHAQRSTLTTLHLHALPSLPSQQPPDLAQFEALTDLTLTSHSTGHRPGTESFFIPPRLRRFTWTLGVGPDAELPSPLDFMFGGEHERWLRRFAAICIRRGVPLCRIQLECVLDDQDWKRTGGTWVAVRWPWDYMDRLRGELEGYGIEVSFSSPMGGKPEGCIELERLQPLGEVMAEVVGGTR